MKDTILSTGIDIGTSTTQLIFSRLTMENTGGFGSVPKVEVVDKEIIYRSPVTFTPLLGEESIDGKAVENIVRRAYKDAGFRPGDIDTGAVIITGETAGKRNAKNVLASLSDIAGDFVVAAAGPDLESVLSGKGAGAAELSANTGNLVANLDIGGGTTNISYFLDGDVVDTACYSIGGRILKFNDKKVSYISPALQPFLDIAKIKISKGDRLDDDLKEKLRILAGYMAEVLAAAIGMSPVNKSLQEKCITNHGIHTERKPDCVMLSGGVAECVERLERTQKTGEQIDEFYYGDIGFILAGEILKQKAFSEEKRQKAKETLRATVVGAGNYSMEVSGSTIIYQNASLPKKNLMVYSLLWQQEADLLQMKERIRLVKKRHAEAELDDRGKGEYVLAFSGPENPSFPEIEKMADAIIDGFNDEIEEDKLPIIMIEHDIGKVLGQAIRRRIGRNKSLLCIDGISCKQGDFVDVGKPVAGHQVLPVVVKTLLFEGKSK